MASERGMALAKVLVSHILMVLSKESRGKLKLLII